MLWIILIQGLLVFGRSSACNPHLETFHTGIWKVPEDTQHTLNISLSFNESSEMKRNFQTSEDLEALLVVTVVPEEDWKLDFVHSSVVFTAQEVNEGVVKNITFSGYYWGITQLSFYLTRNDLDPDFKNRTLLRDDLQVVVDRRSRVVDIIFITVVSLFILFNNINMGAQLDIKLIWGVLKKPVGPICGLLSQFICMPTVTWIMGSLLFTDTLQRLGLFTYGCCPGGTSSNFWTLMLNGDLNLSITMTAISFLAAMGMMPLWMFTLGSRLTEGNDTIVIPFSNLAISLVALSLPVCIGILIRLKKPVWADKGKKILKSCSLFVLTFFLTAGIYNSYKVFLMMNWYMIIAGILVVITGYTFGALFAKIMCLERAQIIAVSIETAMQNTGVATILLKLSLDSPFSDLASIPIFATFFVTGPPLIIGYFSYKIFKRIRNCKTGKSITKPQQVIPSPAESTPFLSGSEGKTNDVESKDVCRVTEDSRVTTCSVEYEGTENSYVIKENMEDNCRGKHENMEDNCRGKGDNMEDNCGGKEENMEDNCGGKDENMENKCGGKDENMKDNCGGKNETMKNNCGGRDENNENNCGGKDENMKDICGGKDENMKDNYVGKDENMEDNCGGKDENMKDNRGGKDENMEDSCGEKDENMEDNCGGKGENMKDDCGGRNENMENNCRGKDGNMEGISGREDGEMKSECGINGEDLKDNCGMKDGDMEYTCRRKGDDMKDKCERTGDGVEDNCRIGDDIENNYKSKDDDMEDNCGNKGNDVDNNCGLNNDDIVTNCGINGDDLEKNCGRKSNETENNYGIKGIDIEDKCGIKADDMVDNDR
ncbi:uncharacterized protein [Palaemon carinicauda]|uniref:uncharacterized protein n=1 Tax=Palaemon carinicauda TaxID=392227 RepID=UPI0035B5A512